MLGQIFWPVAITWSRTWAVVSTFALGGLNASSYQDHERQQETRVPALQDVLSVSLTAARPSHVVSESQTNNSVVVA
jgi:hypothetical protein